MQFSSFRSIFSFTLLFLGLCKISAQISTPEVLAAGYSDVVQIEVQDFDNDGLEDILVVYSYSNSGARSGLYLHKAIQEGNQLRHKVEKITDRAGYNFWLTDLNGDQWMDVIMRSAYDPGQPGLELVTFINMNGQLEKVENDLSFFLDETRNLKSFVDINADGFDDILYTQEGDPSFHDTLKVAINHDGAFNQFITIAPEPGQFKIGDLNNDGLPDFIFEEFVSGQPPVQKLFSHITNEDITFERQLLDTNFAPQKSIFRVEDLNGDQIDEAIILDQKNDVLYAIYGIGSGEPIWHDTLARNITFGQLYDIDFDNDLDIHYQNDDTTYILQNDGSGNFTSQFTNLAYSHDYYLGQFGDESELLPRHYFGITSLHFYYFNNPNYEIKQFRNFQFSMESLDDIEILDINEDGYFDIVFASRFSDLVGYFPGLPNKNYGPLVPIINNERGAKSISFADFNNDGQLDLNVSGIWSGQNHILYGEGGGHFGEKQLVFDDLYLTRGEAVGDFDSDGYPDIVMGDFYNNALYLKRNHEGIFQDIDTISIQFEARKLHARDIDFDGDDDIVYRTNGMLRWLTNENGNFGSEQFLANAVVSDYFFIDMDNDGKDEIFSADEDDIFINKWNGESYALWKSILGNETNSYAHFVPFDYNGDGFIDLIVSLDLNTQRLFQNVNNESFEYDGLLQERYDFTIRDLHKINDFVLDLDADGDYDWIFARDRKVFKVSNLFGDESIQGNVYWDENLDSLRNSEELVIPNARITAFNGLDEEFYAFSDDFGNFKFFLDPNQYILFATPPNECWQSLPPENIAVNYTANMPINSISFRMENLGADKPELSASISRQPTRCGFTVRYFVSISNEGCKTFDGKATFELDARVPSFSNIDLPNFSLDGNSILFDIENLDPGQRFRFDLLVEVPGVEFIGEEMVDQIEVIDSVQSSPLYSKRFYSEITCAYDPNDKLASPDRSNEYGNAYILDEFITYTIRFQNTGNDTAFNIRLADTLSELLDLSTFRPVDASHDYSILLNSNERILEVFFEDILLPDSNVNYIGSNGFFTFLIKPKEMLPEFTPIQNQASIYFDFNPPIITNLVENTYVSDLSLVTSTNTLEKAPVHIYPNPNAGQINIDSEFPILNVQVFDLTGALVSFQQKNGFSQISIEERGIFFIKVQTSQSSHTQKIVIQ